MAISFPAYTMVTKGTIVDLVCTLSVEELYEEELTSSIELPLVINEYQSALANIAVQASSYKVSGTEEISAGTIIGSGSFVVGNEITLTAQPAAYNENARYTYIWYAKNSFGGWEVVSDGNSDDSTYIFTMQASSPTEYKLVYTATKVYTISLSYECIGNSVEYIDEVTLIGGGVYKQGDVVTISANVSMLEKKDVDVQVEWRNEVDGNWQSPISPNYDYYSSRDSGTWNFTHNYVGIIIDENTPLKYRCFIYVNSMEPEGM